MAKYTVTLAAGELWENGVTKFVQCPSNGEGIDGIIVKNSAGSVLGTFSLVDSNGAATSGIPNMWASGYYIQVRFDTVNSKAQLLNGAISQAVLDKINAITPAQIGAMESGFPILTEGDLFTWASAQSVSGSFTVGDVVTNTPAKRWFKGFFDTSNGGKRLILTNLSLGDSTDGDTYVSVYTGGAWQAWKRLATTDYALPRDGSAAMTGALNFQSANNGSSRVQKSHSDAADYGTFVRDYDKTGNYLTLVIRANAGKVFVSGPDGVPQTILHTGNKPSGSYTGNGSAESRTIETGGIGNAILIYSGTGIAIVTKNGAVVFYSSSASFLAVTSAKFSDGVLTLATTNSVLNGSQTYNYQVL